MYFMSQWSSPCSAHRCCTWQYSYPALPHFVSNSSAIRKASNYFHTFQNSIIRSVDKLVQARIIILATSIPYSKCWYTEGLALCKLRMAFKQILADLTQETVNYDSFFGYSLEMKIPVAKSFGFYQLAHNLYHVDVLCPLAS